MKIYNSIKNIGRKYLAPAIVIAGLDFGSNTFAKTNENLPIFPETKISIEDTDAKIKEKIIEKQKYYDSDINKAFYSFNESIADKYFSRDEQIKVNTILEDTKEYAESEGLILNKQADGLYNLTKKHSNKFFFTKSDLQRKLEEIDVKVQAPGDVYSSKIITSSVGLGLMCYSLTNIIRKIIKNKREKNEI